jgi:hypothetical protein
VSPEVKKYLAQKDQGFVAHGPQSQRGGRMHRDRNARWRHRTGAQHGGAGRDANLIFVLPPNVYVGPPVGGTFWFQIFIQAPFLENLA